VCGSFSILVLLLVFFVMRRWSILESVGPNLFSVFLFPATSHASGRCVSFNPLLL